MTLSPTMMLDEVASYLSMTEREVLKLVRSGQLPATKQGESWRFLREEVDHWLEEQIPHFPSRELHGVEKAPAFLGGKPIGGKSVPILEDLLIPAGVELNAHARTRASVLEELVNVLDRTQRLQDPDSLLTAVREREDLVTTALDGGVAIPHPRKRLDWVVTDESLVFVRTVRGIPFGAEDGALTDLFFLLVCRDDRRHLQVLARMSRILKDNEFLQDLRCCDDSEEVCALLRAREESLVSHLRN